MEEDSRNLLSLLEELKEEGVSLIMISHRLKEVVSIADTITVLRDGTTVCSMDDTEKTVTENMIIRYMVGREMENIYPKREGHTAGEVRFEIRDWTVEDPKSGRKLLDHINLNVRKGEIVGLAGLMGAGRTELALSIFGNTPDWNIKEGSLVLDGENVSFRSPKAAIEAGVGICHGGQKEKRTDTSSGYKIQYYICKLKRTARSPYGERQ